MTIGDEFSDEFLHDLGYAHDFESIIKDAPQPELIRKMAQGWLALRQWDAERRRRTLQDFFNG